MRKVPKYRQLAEYVESKIICGGYAEGRPIPSLRQLMEKFDLSINSARKGVALLADKGLLEFRHGAGTFVPLRRTLPGKVLILVVSNYNGSNRDDSFTSLTLGGIDHAVSEEKIHQRRVSMTAEECSEAVLRKEIASAGADAVILVGGYDEYLRLSQFNRVAVGVGLHQSFDGVFSLIDLDPFRAAELAADYFMRRRKQRLVLVNRDRENLRCRRRLFLQSWSECGGADIDEEYFCTVPQFEEQKGYLYFCGGDALADAQRYRALTGRSLHEDFTILCMDGKPLFNSDHGERIPTLALNWHEAGMLAVQECLRRLSRPGSSARRIYLEPGLYRCGNLLSCK